MTTMLERAARALSDRVGCQWEVLRDDDREMIRDYARAALMAVREPDGPVKTKGTKHHYSLSTNYWDNGMSRTMWMSMIDAILNEEQPK